ncbi:MAG: Fic family protein [Candidatus Spyradosoma sp.]
MSTHLDEIFQFLHYHPNASRTEIETALEAPPSAATMKRLLAGALERGEIAASGTGRATRYSITPKTHLLRTFNVEEYFRKEIDERVVQTSFNFELIRGLLPQIEIFSEAENAHLSKLQAEFSARVAALPEDVLAQEMERLGIDLSWKSSQIEGNTYTLLETERLLRERKEAKGKTHEEAVMLLNHKAAWRFLTKNRDYLKTLTISGIEDVHSLLVKDLGVGRNVRVGRVGITGTNYRPLDNEFQIRDALHDFCALVNARGNVFEKTLFVLLLLSYIQPFYDGNKRTARIVGNALLLAEDCCPLSWRTIDSLDYKEALLVFYEQNNLRPFKDIFMEQFEFAAKTYC